MTGTFEPSSFLDRVAQRLIGDFDDAALAGTPGLVGASREHPARKQLELFLPGIVRVGSGLVMDSLRSFSTQQDIVIYERDHCPVFSINNTPEATYYPAEGVIAVGEVKSTLDKATMEDAMQKIASAKKLRRQELWSDTGLGEKFREYRFYGQSPSFAASSGDEFDQLQRSDSQIYGFLLCHRFATSAETMLKNVTNFLKVMPLAERPNIVISLNDGVIFHFDSATNQARYSAMDASHMAFSAQIGGGFTYLLQCLKVVCRDRRTSPLSVLDAYAYAPSSGPPGLMVSKTEPL